MTDLEAKLKKRLSDTIQTRDTEQVRDFCLPIHSSDIWNLWQMGLSPDRRIFKSCCFVCADLALLFSLFIAGFLKAQIVQLQAELKRLLAKMPRRVRESTSALDKKIMYVQCVIPHFLKTRSCSVID